MSDATDPTALNVDELLDRPHVEPGGEAVEFHIGPHRLRKFSVGPLDNNVYVLVAASGQRLLIDAAADPERILKEIDAAGEGVVDGPLIGILTTHRHEDHTGALAEMIEKTGVPTLAGSADADFVNPPAQHWLLPNDIMEIGEVVRGAEPLKLQIVNVPGHTPGSIMLAVEEPNHPESKHPGRIHLIAGDSLFPGGPGKTETPEQFTQLMDNLERRIFAKYPDNTRVYPGHGGDTLLGLERPHLAEWRERGW